MTERIHLYATGPTWLYCATKDRNCLHQALLRTFHGACCSRGNWDQIRSQIRCYFSEEASAAANPVSRSSVVWPRRASLPCLSPSSPPLCSTCPLTHRRTRSFSFGVAQSEIRWCGSLRQEDGPSVQPRSCVVGRLKSTCRFLSRPLFRYCLRSIAAHLSAR